MEDSAGSVTQVRIYNQTYAIRSADAAEYVEQLARHLDEKMSEVAEGTATVDTTRVAVLAALNVVDDYFKARQALEGLEAEVREKAVQLTTRLQEAAGEAG